MDTLLIGTVIGFVIGGALGLLGGGGSMGSPRRRRSASARSSARSTDSRSCPDAAMWTSPPG